MFRELCVCICLALIPEATRAANKPHVAADAQTVKIWTNDDLDRLHHLGLISIVGPIRLAQSASEFVPQPNETTRDPAWYADEASGLRDERQFALLRLEAGDIYRHQGTRRLAVSGCPYSDGRNLDAFGKAHVFKYFLWNCDCLLWSRLVDNPTESQERGSRHGQESCGSIGGCTC